MKSIVFIISIFLSSVSYSKQSDTIYIHESLNLPVYNSTMQDITGNGLLDNISLEVIEDEDGFRNFTLTVNQNSVQGIHSYNVFGFLIIDLDTSDKKKEVSVYTGGVNGPDEHIIYSYTPGELSEIGRIYNNAFFPGNSTVITETQMTFWTRIDTIRYRPEIEFFFYPSSEVYDMHVETLVLEEFELLSDTSQGAVTLGYLEKGKMVKIVKADVSPICLDEDDREICDWYLFETSTGTQGWARLKSFLNKVDLPWRI